MKKHLKVLLLSGVTLLMVACMDQAEDTVDVSSSSESTAEVLSETEVEESVEEVSDADLSEDASLVETDEESADDASEDASETDVSSDDEEIASDASEENSESTESDEASSDEESETDASEEEDAESTESDASESSDEAATDDEASEVEEDVIEPVVVDMLNQDGESMGTATFEEAANGVILTLELEGLEAGEYGFHIHEYGKATPPTFMDALGHFNPTDASHGLHSEEGPHVGDFPNLVVGEDGIVSIVLVVSNVSLDPEAPMTLRTENGTSLIIHEGPDDYETQPIGTAGYGMIGGVIFAPLNEDATVADTSEESDEAVNDDETSEEDSQMDSSEEESSESESSSDASSDSSSDDEATEAESNSEE